MPHVPDQEEVEEGEESVVLEEEDVVLEPLQVTYLQLPPLDPLVAVIRR